MGDSTKIKKIPCISLRLAPPVKYSSSSCARSHRYSEGNLTSHEYLVVQNLEAHHCWRSASGLLLNQTTERPDPKRKKADLHTRLSFLFLTLKDCNAPKESRTHAMSTP